MKKVFILMLLPVLMSCHHKKAVVPKKKSGLVFTPLLDLPALPVGDQGHSGTCWAFAATSFLES